MKRSWFKKPQIERKRTVHTPIPEHLRRQVTFARCDVPASQPVEKFEYVRSEPYRRLVAALPCIHCGIEGYSQHAHANEGKGARMKTDDRTGFPLCCTRPGIEGCHADFDQYRLVTGGRDAHRALAREWGAATREQIINSGLWPEKLPQWNEK